MDILPDGSNIPYCSTASKEMDILPDGNGFRGSDCFEGGDRREIWILSFCTTGIIILRVGYPLVLLASLFTEV
jgi:hypothetical protein